MDLLKLIALDNDDVAVLSAHVQDSIVRVGDIMWRPAERRVIVVINRFDWEGAQSLNPSFRRRRAALRFERVDAFKHRNIACGEKDAVLNLLAVEFIPTDTPAGQVRARWGWFWVIPSGCVAELSAIGRTGLGRRS